MHNKWKFYAIPAYLTLCFWIFFSIPQFLELYPITWKTWDIMLPTLWMCLSTMALTTILWWGLIQVLRGVGWVYKQLRRQGTPIPDLNVQQKGRFAEYNGLYNLPSAALTQHSPASVAASIGICGGCGGCNGVVQRRDANTRLYTVRGAAVAQAVF